MEVDEEEFNEDAEEEEIEIESEEETDDWNIQAV